ncbi:MAG: sigma-54 dependent transcriptional regulator [Candidatus Solibacter sp.]|nr:sigma-54 dependent transcriptional regulator [Candidatus Solibacter sp.]
MGSMQVLWISARPELPADWPRHPALWNIEIQPADEAIEALAVADYAAVVLDLPVPGWTAAMLLEAVQRAAPGVPVLARDPKASVGDAVQLAHLGIYQFLPAGENACGLIDLAIADGRRGDLARLAAQVDREDWERILVGGSREMRQLQHIIRLVASRRATVLITGETGTGKELGARALHMAGSRRSGPMVAVNCSALPEGLLESELFGHVRGAFTGAFQNRMGRFEQAQGGTLFLDEIGELPMDLQTKLLRVLQEREVQRLGTSEIIKLDIRVVAATNCDLAQRIEEGKFREDLFYRLNVVPIEMPPLRRRREDVPQLAAHFVDKICRTEGIPVKVLMREALERLCEYSWPGNVRQLENMVEMAVALSGERPTLAPADFPLPAPPADRPMTARAPVVAVPDGGLDYEQTLAVIERSILEQALRKTGGNKKAAADMLRLKRTTLSAKVRSLEPVA